MFWSNGRPFGTNGIKSMQGLGQKGIRGNGHFGTNGHFRTDELWGKWALGQMGNLGQIGIWDIGGMGGLGQIDIWENGHFGPMGVEARGDKWAPEKMT